MELSAVDTVAELEYSARHSLRVGCKARRRMGALFLCWVSVSFVPQSDALPTAHSGMLRIQSCLRYLDMLKRSAVTSGYLSGVVRKNRTTPPVNENGAKSESI